MAVSLGNERETMMKGHHARILILIFANAVAWSHALATDYARISDRTISPPEGGPADNERLHQLVVYEVLAVNGAEVERAKEKKPSDPPYVLLPEGTHRMKILKMRALSLPEAEGEILELMASVEAGCIYRIRESEEGLELQKWQDEESGR
ncbi:MAG: hypothetical protein ACLFU2_14715 [Opitutales bacterium]